MSILKEELEIDHDEDDAEIGETPKPAGMCKFAGCTTMLRSSNTTGWCSIHHGGRKCGGEDLRVAETLEKYERVKPRTGTITTRAHTSLKLAEARELAPPATPSQIETLRAAVFESISVEDVKGLMSGIVTKAKGGDMAAAKLLLGYIGAGGGGRPVNQLVMVQNGGRDAD